MDITYLLHTLQRTLQSQLHLLNPEMALTASALALGALLLMRFVFGIARLFVNLATLLLLLIAAGGGIYVIMQRGGSGW